MEFGTFLTLPLEAGDRRRGKVHELRGNEGLPLVAEAFRRVTEGSATAIGLLPKSGPRELWIP